MSILYKNARLAPKAINGPKGISLFIFLSPKTKLAKPNIAPSQNANKSPANPCDNPKSQPIGNSNFTSPKPIPRPEVTPQRMSMGKASMGPDKNCMMGNPS